MDDVSLILSTLVRRLLPDLPPEQGHAALVRDAETTLAELVISEARYRAVGEAVPFGVWSADADGYLRYVSPAFLDLVGLTLEQVQQFGWTHLLPQEDQQPTLDRWRHCMETGENWHREHHFKTKDGADHSVLSVGRPVRDERGTITSWVGLNLDISQRHQAEQNLVRQARVFDTVLSSISDFAYIFGTDGRFQYVNRALLELWGLPLSHAVGKNFFDLNYPHDLAGKLQRQIQEVVETRRTVTDETPYTSPAGVAGHYEYIFRPVFAADGTVEAVAGSTRDITRRKNAECEREALRAALEAERAKLVSVIEHAPAFICTLRGPQHVFEIANGRYYDIVGRRDIIGRPVREALPEVEGQGYFELLDHVYRTGETFTGNEIPLSLRRGEGDVLERRFVNFVYQALRDSDGNISGIFAHGVDVTDLVAGREALHAANAGLEERVRQRTSELAEVNAKFQAVYDQGVFAGLLDLDGIVLDANRSSVEQCGFARDDVIGKPFWDCGWWNRSPVVRAWVHEGFGRAVRGEPFRGESPYFVADGSERVVEFALTPIKDNAGRIMYVLPTGIDVTDRRRAERERRAAEVLRESEAQFRLIADAMPQIVWVTRPDGYHEYYNRRWYEYLGLDFEQTKGSGWADPLHPDDRERSRRRWQFSLETGEPYEIEYRFRRHDGEYRWFLGRANPVRDAAGNITRWYGTCTDIDEQKRLRDERERVLADERAARADAEAANAAKTRFLAALSHELRTPLTPVLTTAQMMEADPSLSADLREQVAMVRRNVELEVRLIDDLLDVTRVTQGKLELHLSDLDLHEKIAQVADICGSDVRSKQLDLVVDLKASRPFVRGDGARVQQFLWNLLKNAIKFTPAGGRVTVRSSNLLDGRVVVEVADTGVGIEPEALPKVFNAFEQGGQEVTRLFGGLGLGLSISKALVEQHGGTLTAASEGRGRGATFSVVLPTMSPPVIACTVVSPGMSLVGGYRILLVEDHADTARVMARLLSREGCEVRTAGTVAAALRELEASKFDLLISDIGLPDGSGLDLMRQVRLRHGVKGIALSGYGMEEDVRGSADAGFDAHLTKPVDMLRLEEAVRDVLA